MSIEQTLDKLLSSHGMTLLEQPLRLEGFLKDLHPENPREVFLLCEALFSGLVAKLQQTTKIVERDKQKLVLELVQNSGVAITFAFWTIEIWAEVLSNNALLHKNTSLNWKGTLDDVLTQHTKR